MIRRKYIWVGLVTVALFSGTSACHKTHQAAAPKSMTDEIATQIVKHISEPKKQHLLLSLARDVDVEVMQFTQRSTETLNRLAMLDRKHDAKESEFNALSSKLTEDHRSTMERIASLRIQMRQNLSRDEWVEIHRRVKTEK